MNIYFPKSFYDSINIETPYVYTEQFPISFSVGPLSLWIDSTPHIEHSKHDIQKSAGG